MARIRDRYKASKVKWDYGIGEMKWSDNSDEIYTTTRTYPEIRGWEADKVRYDEMKIKGSDIPEIPEVYRPESFCIQCGELNTISRDHICLSCGSMVIITREQAFDPSLYDNIDRVSGTGLSVEAIRKIFSCRFIIEPKHWVVTLPIRGGLIKLINRVSDSEWTIDIDESDSMPKKEKQQQLHLFDEEVTEW